MPLRNPKQKSVKGRFTQVGEEPLGPVIGVRVPLSIHQELSTIPNRNEWLRQLIVNAVKERNVIKESD